MTAVRPSARSGWRRLFAVVAVAGALMVPARAQQLDPRTLQTLQSALGAGNGQNNASAQLDASRERASGVDPVERSTPEEVAVRRERSRVALADASPLSPLEREYQQRLGDTTLRQFGYDLFRNGQTAGPLTGSVAGDYTLGIGDELIVNFQGASPGSQTARVDREGRLIVGQLPPIAAAGRSLGAVRADLAAATRRTLLGTEVSASVGSVRAVSVFVGGEVNSPGIYQLTSLADVVSAIGQAGGLRKTGSLRRVRVIRAGGGFEVDLYGLLGIGVPRSARLREGDRIIVPVIGPTVAVGGGVARPGIYELRGTASVGSVLAYAGGPVRPRGSRVSISRIASDGSEVFVRGLAPTTAVIAGDALQVLGGSAGGAIGRVVLRGFVLNPGPRPLTAAPTLRDLVGERQDLRPQTYLPMAVVARLDALTGAKRFVAVDLGAALRGGAPFALQSEDRVYVLASSDAEFINRVAVRNIVLGGGNPQPGCRALERLAALVRDTQGPRYNSVVRGTFGASRVASVAAALAQRSRGGQVGEGGARDAGDVGTPTLGEGTGLGQSSAASGPDTRRVIDSDENDIACPAVFQDEPELLPVLIENAVNVGGAVRAPGAYPVVGAVSADTLATLAGGLLDRAEGIELDVTRARGAGDRTERLPLTREGRFPPLAIRAGDDIRFNAGQPQFEPGGVLLTGEVARPGLYTIRRGETLSALLARAGGVTGLSYPYGAVFTRRAVRESQAEGLQRTARELNEALLVASVRASSSQNGGGAAGIGQAAGFINAIAQVDPIGRVVIEADPRVLARRPDLDTVLEAGDTLFVPKRPGFVLTLGDVGNPGAQQFVGGKTVDEYLNESGGFRRTSDRARAFVVLPNGATQQLAASFGRRSRVSPPPGSTIIVPVNTTRFLGLSVARDIATIVGQFISSVATVALLAK